MNFNKVTLVGRLTKEPELRSTTTGKNVCSFSIAVNKRTKPKDGGAEADFFNVSAWNQTAEYVNQYAGKGRLVIVDGRIESRDYIDRDGNKRQVWEVTADTVTLLDRARDDDGAPRAPREPAPVREDRPPAPLGDDEYDPFADA